ncbi:MAG: adaptor protein MecA, partial [Clostridia bacterium]|nr:adaptor protein MecA [Clostridia bacterium]
LLENGLTPDAVAKNTFAAQEVFWDVIHRAEAEAGFSIGSGQLMIEAMSGSDGELILYITRLDREKPGAAERPGKRAKVKAKRPREIRALCFASFEDVISLAKSFPDLSGGELYFYNDKYYLTLPQNRNMNLAEFAAPVFSAYIVPLLEEHGKHICSDALDKIRESF